MRKPHKGAVEIQFVLLMGILHGHLLVIGVRCPWLVCLSSSGAVFIASGLP